jgi:hypothetical protein
MISRTTAFSGRMNKDWRKARWKGTGDDDLDEAAHR